MIEVLPTVAGQFSRLKAYAFVGVTKGTAQMRYGVERIQMYVGTFKPIEFIATKRADMVHLKAIELREGDQPVLGLHLFSPAARKFSRSKSCRKYLNLSCGRWKI